MRFNYLLRHVRQIRISITSEDTSEIAENMIGKGKEVIKKSNGSNNIELPTTNSVGL